MQTKTLEAIAALLNANRAGSGNVHFDALTELAVLAYGDGSFDWSRENGYTVSRQEAPTPSPVVSDLRTETLGQLVALFEAFDARDDDVFEARLANLDDYLRRHGWIDITSDDGYVVSAAKTPVLPYEALKRMVYVLNAWTNDTVLTFHDGLVKLAGYLVGIGLLAHSKDTGYFVLGTEAPDDRDHPLLPKDTGYSIPETNAPEPRIIPFTAKED